MPTDQQILADERRVLAHPLRVAILEAMQVGVRSPSSIADEIDQPLGNVSYHVKALLAHGMIELVNTEPRRGAVEHYYRATAKASTTDSATLDAIAVLLRGYAGADPDEAYSTIEAIETAVEATGRKVT